MAATSTYFHSSLCRPDSQEPPQRQLPVAQPAAYCSLPWLSSQHHALAGGPPRSRMVGRSRPVRAAPWRHDWLDAISGHLTSVGTFVQASESLWVAPVACLPASVSVMLRNRACIYTTKRLAESSRVLACHLYFSPFPRARMAHDFSKPIISFARCKRGDLLGKVRMWPHGPTDHRSCTIRCNVRACPTQQLPLTYTSRRGLGAGTSTPCLEPGRRCGTAFALSWRRSDFIVARISHTSMAWQPYGCGCILFRRPGRGRFYNTTRPLLLQVSAGSSPGRNQPGSLAATRFRLSACGPTQLPPARQNR